MVEIQQKKTFFAQGNLIIATDGARLNMEHICSYFSVKEKVKVFTVDCPEGMDFDGSIEDFDDAYAEAYTFSKCLALWTELEVMKRFIKTQTIQYQKKED